MTVYRDVLPFAKLPEKSYFGGRTLINYLYYEREKDTSNNMLAGEYVHPRQESLLSVIANSATLETYVIDKELL